jgi:hypothetical protein
MAVISRFLQKTLQLEPGKITKSKPNRLGKLMHANAYTRVSNGFATVHKVIKKPNPPILNYT